MRFSVIIPVYNKALYVRKALESVFAQTFSDYEVVIMDDGSTDNSYEIVQDCIQGHTNIVHLKQQNSGVSAARNNAIRASQGEYICLLDADDWWENTFLEKMDWLIKEYPEAGLYATNYYYYKNGKGILKLNVPTGYYNYFKEYANAGAMIATSSLCFNKKIIEVVGEFNLNLSLGEDFDLIVRIAKDHKTAFLNEPLVYFNQDLAPGQRATHKLHNPAKHMLWNLGYMEPYEKTNPDYKQLIDRLRIYGLMPYFLSQEYHDLAVQELSKVDWSKQSTKWQKEYKKPLMYLRLKNKFMKFGSKVKQWIIQKIK